MRPHKCRHSFYCAPTHTPTHTYRTYTVAKHMYTHTYSPFHELCLRRKTFLLKVRKGSAGLTSELNDSLPHFAVSS